MKTGLESLDIGAPKITYSGNEGPQSPQQMAEIDPLLLEEYEKYFSSHLSITCFKLSNLSFCSSSVPIYHV